MGETTVQVWVSTPDDEIKLRRSAETEPAIFTGEAREAVNAENVAATASHILGDLADEVLAHFGYTDAFRQYIAISEILNGNDSGQEGKHVGEVRKLCADRDQARAAAQSRAEALAWVSDPANWVAEFKHQHTPGATPRENFATRHNGETPLPMAMLNRFADMLMNRLGEITSAARQAPDDDAARDAVESVLRHAFDAAASNSRYVMVLGQRPRPGHAFVGTIDSSAPPEEIQVPFLSPEVAAEMTQALPRVQLDEGSARAAGLHSPTTEEGK